MSLTTLGEIIGSLAQAAGATYNVSQTGPGQNINTVDAAVSSLGAAFTSAQQVAAWAGRNSYAYNLGIGGIVTNLAAFELARVQMADAQARNDAQGYYAATAAAVAAAAGMIAGIPLLPSHIRAAAVAIRETLNNWPASCMD